MRYARWHLPLVVVLSLCLGLGPAASTFAAPLPSPGDGQAGLSEPERLAPVASREGPLAHFAFSTAAQATATVTATAVPPPRDAPTITSPTATVYTNAANYTIS